MTSFYFQPETTLTSRMTSWKKDEKANDTGSKEFTSLQRDVLELFKDAKIWFYATNNEFIDVLYGFTALCESGLDYPRRLEEAVGIALVNEEERDDYLYMHLTLTVIKTSIYDAIRKHRGQVYRLRGAPQNPELVKYGSPLIVFLCAVNGNMKNVVSRGQVFEGIFSTDEFIKSLSKRISGECGLEIGIEYVSVLSRVDKLEAGLSLLKKKRGVRCLYFFFCLVFSVIVV